MAELLENFRVIGLHGRTTVNARITDNILIIVGENGAGKTTFLRILFHFLSGRWLQLVQFKFDSISAKIAGVEYKVTHDELVKAFRVVDKRFLSEMPPSLRRQVVELMENGEIHKISSLYEKYGSHYRIPSEELLRQMDFFEESSKRPKNNLQENISKIQKAINAQVLYLPTYRRIERELNSIFEGADAEDIRRNRARVRQPDNGDAFVELVEFGMKDVQQAVDRTLEGLKEFAREGLNNLTLRYLGDVVNKEYKNVGTKEIADVSEETVRAVLNRIDDRILTKDHKDHLVGVIDSARSADEPSEHERIIYHYFLKLLGFQESLQEKERQITEFCSLCSEYIVDKSFVYDSPSFTFRIIPRGASRSEKDIELGDLSSGEKQIVSLFSHLYLSGKQSFFVLIDEPELSLSVPWQRRFLVDIRNGKFCKGLVAVTHSPFIYDNELRPYTHSLGEFVSV